MTHPDGQPETELGKAALAIKQRAEQAEAEVARLTKEFEHYKTVVAPASRLAVMADCPNCKALEQQRNEWEQRWQQAEAHISKMSDVFLRLGKAVNLADKVVESLHEVPALVESLKQAEAGLVHKDESVALADHAVDRLKQELARVTAKLHAVADGQFTTAKQRQLEQRVTRIQIEAKKIFSDKGSYDVEVDARVRKEYEAAYAFIKRLADHVE